MIKFRLMVIAICFGMLSCSENKSEPLPNLPAVPIPTDMVGTFSGRLPCDDCKAQMVRAVFSADSSVMVVRTIMKDSTTIDTLQGRYTMTADSIIAIAIENGRYSWNFKRSSLGNLALLNGSHEIYVDEDGLKCEWFRVYSIPNATPKKTEDNDLKNVGE